MQPWGDQVVPFVETSELSSGWETCCMMTTASMLETHFYARLLTLNVSLVLHLTQCTFVCTWRLSMCVHTTHDVFHSGALCSLEEVQTGYGIPNTCDPLSLCAKTVLLVAVSVHSLAAYAYPKAVVLVLHQAVEHAMHVMQAESQCQGRHTSDPYSLSIALLKTCRDTAHTHTAAEPQPFHNLPAYQASLKLLARWTVEQLTVLRHIAHARLQPIVGNSKKPSHSYITITPSHSWYLICPAFSVCNPCPELLPGDCGSGLQEAQSHPDGSHSTGTQVPGCDWSGRDRVWEDCSLCHPHAHVHHEAATHDGGERAGWPILGGEC